MSRRLVLIRHAKAETFGPSDHDRPLAPRGHHDARAVGEWLGSAGVDPDVVLVSSALRTRETYADIAGAAGWTLDPWIDSTLYEAGVDTAYELLHAQLPEVSTLVVVGHNPTIAQLAFELDDGTGETLGEFATAGVAVLEFDTAWTHLEPGAATVVDYTAPRG